MSEYYTIPKISNSLMKHALISLEEFKYQWDTVTIPKEETAAMVFGNVCHTMLLEPQEFDSRYAVKRFDGRTKEGKEEKAYIESRGLKTVSQEDMEKAEGMALALTDSMYVDPDLVAKIQWILSLDDLENEKEMFWIDEATGLECKGKLDAYSREHHLVFDYKTIEDLSDHGIGKNFANYRYDLAVAHYSEGIKRVFGDETFPTFIFCVQEKSEPYNFRLFTPDQEMLGKGLVKRAELLGKIKEAFDNNAFYSHRGVETISMPSWLN